jgi:aspartate/methionine/tyrosine aminotransferase
MMKKSATLKINEQMQEYARKGVPVVNLGFGEAGLPVLPVFRELVVANSHLNAYPPVQGGRGARNAVASYFRRRRIDADPQLCLTAPGSKAILYGLLASLPGDVVLARPSWVSYAAQAGSLGKRTVWCDIPAATGGIPDPDLLPGVLEQARRDGRDPRILILTSPDNPTGTVARADQLHKLAQIAVDHDLTVISDEIYRDLAYDPDEYTSIAEIIPDRTVVTSGLSKSLALGGWRLGVARFPATAEGEALYDRFIALASELWSGTPILLEAVVEYAFSEPADVVERVAQSRRLHGAVSQAIFRILRSAGASVRPPAGGFYLYPTFAGSALAERLGVHTDVELADALLSSERIGALPGSSFGDRPERLGLRLVTSMVYGRSDAERLATLRAADPLQAEPVRSALEVISAAFSPVDV